MGVIYSNLLVKYGFETELKPWYRNEYVESVQLRKKVTKTKLSEKKTKNNPKIYHKKPTIKESR